MKPTPITDEKDLLLRLRDGDEAAFTALYDRYAGRITAKLFRLLKSRELAQDILQDVFMKVWDVRATLDPERSFSAYLYTIAVNLAANSFRRSLREAYMRAEIGMGEESHNPIEEAIDARDRQDILHRALAKLPRRQREVYTLHKLEGKSYNEISQQLGITPSAINQHIHRATKSLRQALDPELGILLAILSASLSAT